MATSKTKKAQTSATSAAVKLELTPAQLATVREALQLHLSMLHHDRTDYEQTPAQDARLAAKEDVAFAILRALERV